MSSLPSITTPPPLTKETIPEASSTIEKRNDARVIYCQDKARFEKGKRQILRLLPENTRKWFGSLGFIIKGGEMKPILTVSPYDVDPSIRDLWLTNLLDFKKENSHKEYPFQFVYIYSDDIFDRFKTSTILPFSKENFELSQSKQAKLVSQKQYSGKMTEKDRKLLFGLKIQERDVLRSRKERRHICMPRVIEDYQIINIGAFDVQKSDEAKVQEADGDDKVEEAGKQGKEGGKGAGGLDDKSNDSDDSDDSAKRNRDQLRKDYDRQIKNGEDLSVDGEDELCKLQENPPNVYSEQALDIKFFEQAPNVEYSSPRVPYKTSKETLEEQKANFHKWFPASRVEKFGEIGFGKRDNRLQPILEVSPYHMELGYRSYCFTMIKPHLEDMKNRGIPGGEFEYAFVWWYGYHQFSPIEVKDIRPYSRKKSRELRCELLEVENKRKMDILDLVGFTEQEMDIELEPSQRIMVNVARFLEMHEVESVLHSSRNVDIKSDVDMASEENKQGMASSEAMDEADSIGGVQLFTNQEFEADIALADMSL